MFLRTWPISKLDVRQNPHRIVRVLFHDEIHISWRRAGFLGLLVSELSPFIFHTQNNKRQVSESPNLTNGFPRTHHLINISVRRSFVPLKSTHNLNRNLETIIATMDLPLDLKLCVLDFVSSSSAHLLDLLLIRCAIYRYQCQRIWWVFV